VGYVLRKGFKKPWPWVEKSRQFGKFIDKLYGQYFGQEINSKELVAAEQCIK
jgi:hypothetical protein